MNRLNFLTLIFAISFISLNSFADKVKSSKQGRADTKPFGCFRSQFSPELWQYAIKLEADNYKKNGNYSAMSIWVKNDHDYEANLTYGVLVTDVVYTGGDPDVSSPENDKLPPGQNLVVEWDLTYARATCKLVKTERTVITPQKP